MAHFAELNENNIVTRVIVVDNKDIIDDDGVEQEALGITFCTNLFGNGTNWKQTSYNGTFRKNYAGIDYTYDADRDAFIPPKPFDSWLLNEQTCLWEAPVPYPSDDNFYIWNETTLSWDLIEEN